MEVETNMATRHDDRTLGEMLSELSAEFKSLVQQELQLARIELSQKAARMRKGLVFIIGGALFAYGGFLALIAAIVLGMIGAACLPGWRRSLPASCWPGSGISSRMPASSI
jgi:uncharacterized membrane protein YqjE